MRIFKNEWFARFAKKENISDEALCKAVKDIEKGLVDADLGGGVIKQRIAREGQGTSGGFRSIILYKQGVRAFFVFGFSKNQRANIENDELRKFKKLAGSMLGMSDQQIAEAKRAGVLLEVSCDG